MSSVPRLREADSVALSASELAGLQATRNRLRHKHEARPIDFKKRPEQRELNM
jgi:hypothetical protein